MVRGIVVRSRNAIASIGAGFKAMAGGEIKTFTTLCEGARDQALQRCFEHAAELGATGIVGLRYDTNLICPGMTEVVAYGTAVVEADAASSSNAAASKLDASLVCTTNDIPGVQATKCLGVSQGLIVRSRNVIAAIGAGFKSMVGGEIKGYTKMCEDCRKDAYDRMIEEARQLGAHAVVAVRYQTGEIIDGVTEVLCFGTAVTVAGLDASDAAPAQSRILVTTSSVMHGSESPQLQRLLGIAQGITVKSSNVIANIGASFKTIVGGEIKTWSKLCRATREDAFNRMLEQGELMGAKAIVAMRYDANQVNEGIVEVIAYGTALGDGLELANIPPVPSALSPQFVTSNLDIPGQNIQYSAGIVRGISVQSINLLLGIGAGFKSIVGGEIRNYTDMCQKARQAAFEQMLQQATAIGATGIIGFRFECNDLVPGTVEVIAYGTAVSVNPPPAVEPTFQYGIDVSLVTTTNRLAQDTTTRSLGVVRGITVRSRNIAANFGAGLKAAFVGGEVSTWTKLCDQARVHAYERMLEEAQRLGAKGIVAMRFETNELAPGISEVLSYGTAVA